MYIFRKMAPLFAAVAVIICLILPLGCSGKETTGGAPRITNHEAGPGYEGYCLVCHGPGNGPSEYPPDHAGRTSSMCLTCHHT